MASADLTQIDSQFQFSGSATEKSWLPDDLRVLGISEKISIITNYIYYVILNF